MEDIALVLKENGILLFGLPNASNKMKVFGLIPDHHGEEVYWLGWSFELNRLRFLYIIKCEQNVSVLFREFKNLWNKALLQNIL